MNNSDDNAAQAGSNKASALLTSRPAACTYLLISMAIAFFGFFVLADLTQFLLEVPRWVTMTAHSFRMMLFWLGVAALIAGFLAGRRYFSRRLLTLVALATMAVSISGYINPPYLMFRTQQHTARFVSSESLRNAPMIELREDNEVFVVEVNGDARAYPLDWVMQPHVAGDVIGGETVALTYCSLSHLGMAVEPRLNGQELDLKLLTQLQNNLVMFDTKTNKPIQQIWASFDGETERMRELPTRIMSFGTFQALYPQGLVFFNPPYSPWDKLVRWMMYSVVGLQHALDEPVFPTIHEFDSRLPNKAYVYGVNMNGQQVAFTLDAIKAQGNVLNTEVGGEPLALVYFEELGFVDAFHRRIDGRTVTVTDIDPYGNTAQGQLQRAVMAHEVFWFIWNTFYPATEVRI
jgi:hypothetical protein